mmetsp:Transcript_108078/g.305585  ORF Transcript_108078/g.305585 Transcript_108078/m.305585 type:complete len:220 (-) Transcript_108078:223-882(-)
MPSALGATGTSASTSTTTTASSTTGTGRASPASSAPWRSTPASCGGTPSSSGSGASRWGAPRSPGTFPKRAPCRSSGGPSSRLTRRPRTAGSSGLGKTAARSGTSGAAAGGGSCRAGRRGCRPGPPATTPPTPWRRSWTRRRPTRRCATATRCSSGPSMAGSSMWRVPPWPPGGATGATGSSSRSTPRRTAAAHRAAKMGSSMPAMLSACWRTPAATCA